MLTFLKSACRRIRRILAKSTQVQEHDFYARNLRDVEGKKNYSDLVKFNVKSLHWGHHKLLYKDVPMMKCPFDYVIYQMILWEVKPDLIIEIGTNNGGSALYFADLLDMIGHGEIHTIDIADKAYEQAKKHKRIKFFMQGYELYDLKNIEGFKNIIIIEDGSHMYADVKATLLKFSSFVNKDSYFIVEDGILDKLGLKRGYKGGPNKAIKEFISKSDSYIIDRKWCDLFGINATFNTNGFLKRI